jgi:group II intron reverse transcriptase/maturase
MNIYIFTNIKGRSIVGKTGEPRPNLPWVLGRRVRSTCLLEREPAMVKRMHFTKRAHTEGKEPKWTDFNKDVPYLNEFQKSIRASDDAIKTLRRLKRLWCLGVVKKNAKAQGLSVLLGDINLWVAAYNKLASNEGSMTKGGSGGTIDGTSIRSLEILRNEVINGRYKFGMTRRVYIPKPKGGQRPLGIPAFRDRLLQEAVRTILEVIYEPRFLETSHGFRPQRSQHTCLRQIRRDFQGSKWFIEGDISKCFDTIEHQTVRKCLNKVIDDSKFVNLLVRGLKTKVLMPKGSVEWQAQGTPQGGVCSPLLSNVVLHQLDRYMARLKRVIDIGIGRKQTKEYVRIYNKMRKATPEDKIKYRKEARKAGYGDPMDSQFRRLSYTRYADDFLIGIAGSKELARRVKHNVARFLQTRLNLKLSLEKTGITRALTGRVPFLGYVITSSPKRAYSYTRIYAGRKRLIRAHRSGNITLLVDIRKVMERLILKGFCDRNFKPLPNFKYLPHPQSYTLKAINRILRGLCNYYKLSENLRQSMSRISFTVRYSTAKLFAAKYRLHTMAKIFRKAGKDLGKPLKGPSIGANDEKLKHDAKAAGGELIGEFKGLLYTKYKQIPSPDLKPLAKGWKPMVGPYEDHMTYPLTTYVERTLRGRTALKGVCASCRSTVNVEMHHVRKLADLKGRSYVEKVMIASNRKQIPLCRPCHLAAHGKASH